MQQKTLMYLLGGASVLILGVMGYVWLAPTHPVFQYTTAASRELTETVSVNAPIQGAEQVDLSFDRTGQIAKVYANVGDVVKAGQPLLALDNSLEASQLAGAEATLNQHLAGSTSANIQMAQAAVDAAKADLDKAKADASTQQVAAEAAYDTAWSNLQLANGGENSQVVTEAYQTAIASLKTVLPKLSDALTQANTVLGVDNSGASSFPQQYNSLTNANTLNTAKTLYYQAKNDYGIAEQSVNDLVLTSAHDTVDQALGVSLTAADSSNKLLGSVSDVLNNVSPQGSLTPDELAAEKTLIENTQVEVAGTYSTLVSQQQAITAASTSLTKYTIAYNQAVQNVANVKSSTEATVSLKEAAYQQALANLSATTAPPRAVDVAALRAAVAAASATFDKTILKSPIDGIITRQDGKVGASVVPNVAIISVINGTALQIKPLLAENDIAKVAVGDQVDVTIDAYGLGTIFPAQVVAIDPALSTAADGTSGYQVTIQFTGSDSRIKTGMTANASIVVATTTAAVAVPKSAVIQRDGESFVHFLSHGNVIEEPVIVGVKGDDGWWEITSGLSDGQQVVNFGN